MKIGELANAVGVSTRALRYYEEQGLMTPQRTAGGQREYEPDAIERVRWIRQMYAAGLASTAVSVLLPCVYSRSATPDVVARLMSERDRLDAQIAELMLTRNRLETLVIGATHPESCGDGGSQPKVIAPLGFEALGLRDTGTLKESGAGIR